ncbi:MAG: N-acetylmuramoyl-L-alanine amidase [candidate division WOR-3 bacterium]|nr:N-acetylmuramoyl-L-alanine amidase [candidate division WOR-3 bacterium]MCX7948331.1 N-acetylmuramoyl-L-alanine amidase [candidate division WOR-3 bacterium]MDW8150841.1 N-acetylmuramoyl-L-alanine amidase [candidate division WOR-3 bacterium]
MLLLDSIFSIYSIKFLENFAYFKNDTVFLNFQDSTFFFKDKKFKFSYKLKNNKIYVDGQSISLIIYRLTAIPIFWDYKENRLIRANETINKFQLIEEDDSCILIFSFSKNLKEQAWLEDNALIVHIIEGFYPKFNYISGEGKIIDSIRILHTKEGAFFKIFLTNKYGSYKKLKEGDVLKFTIYSYANFGYIIIDPGHGGKDPGAIGKWGIKEKDITLSVSKKIANILRKEYGFKVVLTRETDTFVSLKERAEIANTLKAKLFVSIHCNYAKEDNASGPETFFLSVARTNEERAVEALENSVIKYELEEADEIKYIVSDILQNAYLKESQRLAFFIHSRINKNRNDRGVKQAGFYVLRGVYAPSVLVELGFISNEKEAKLLSTETYQEELARKIAEGIRDYINWHIRR